MARPEQVLLLEPQHELKFRGKRGGPSLDIKGGGGGVLQPGYGLLAYGRQIEDNLQCLIQQCVRLIFFAKHVIRTNARSAASSSNGHDS